VTRQGRRWTPQAVARVLTNPVYACLMTLGEELHEGVHDSIVARERFEQVQVLRQAPSTKPQERGRNPEYLLRGLLHCACGYALTPGSTRRGKVVHRYYRCIARDKQGKGSCGARPLRAETIEEVVRQRLATLVTSKAGQATLATRVPSRIAAERDELRRQKAGLKERLATLGGALEQLQACILEAGSTTQELYEGRIVKVTAEREQLKKQLRAVDARLGVIENLTLDAVWIGQQLQSFAHVWEQVLPHNRQRLVRSVVQRIDVDEPTGAVDITLQPWCAALMPEAS
jgi:hypothetical protein